MVFIFTVLGLAFGSFATVLLERLPTGEGIGGRSRCPVCRKPLRILELVPLLSFAILRGRCRSCNARIPWGYPCVELASALLFLLSITLEGTIVHAGILATALWLLLVIAVVDLRTMGIPDSLNVALLMFSVLRNTIDPPFEFSGMLLGLAVFTPQWLLSRGRWLGSGDILLGAALGMLLGGWVETAVALWFAYILGGTVAAVVLLSGKKRWGEHLPMAPFLALGTLLALLVERAALLPF